MHIGTQSIQYTHTCRYKGHAAHNYFHLTVSEYGPGSTLYSVKPPEKSQVKAELAWDNFHGNMEDICWNTDLRGQKSCLCIKNVLKKWTDAGPASANFYFCDVQHILSKCTVWTLCVSVLCMLNGSCSTLHKQKKIHLISPIHALIYINGFWFVLSSFMVQLFRDVRY